MLLNNDVKREQCVKQCVGCNRMFSDENIGDVCEAYQFPKVKWKNYYMETEKVQKSGKEVEVFYHYNPCVLATHITHSPKVEEVRGKLNPLKHSKRGNR